MGGGTLQFLTIKCVYQMLTQSTGFHCKSETTNIAMVTVQNFGVMDNKFNGDRICTYAISSSIKDTTTTNAITLCS